jgi:hypothetical protein
MKDNKVNLTSTVDLFTSLVEEPLLKLTYNPADQPLVIIIDALDECGGFEGHSSSDRQALLQTLGRWPKLSKHFKLLVTSREEGDITRVLSSISAPVDIPAGHYLTENLQAEASIHASNDIRAFLEDRFRGTRTRFPSLPTNWPGTETIADMVSRAAGIFMWATTAANFIDLGLDPQSRLNRIMGHSSESSSMKPLYALYTAILETSFGEIASSDSELDVLRSILGVMVVAKRPLHDREYTKLPPTGSVTIFMLESIRDGLRSVVASGALRFIHKSFDDFLLPEECPSKYAIRMDESQRLLTRLCLTTMTAELRFNICNLETSCLKNADIANIETRIRDGIPALLSYSCCFWADHLVHTPYDEQMMTAVKGMIFDKLLFWFEAMSLLKEVTRVSHLLLLILTWSNVCTLFLVDHSTS